MIYLLGLVGFMLVMTSEARVGNSSLLPFCSETEQCLLFNVVCTSDEYEVRHYDPAKWVSTNETSFFMELAAMKAFRRLYDYISGSNDKGKKIDMTAPVLIKIHDKRFWQRGTYTMSFLLPAEHQKSPPIPTDQRVYIQNSPEMLVYVRHYGGWMTGISDNNEAKSLSAALDLVNAKYQKGFHLSAGYNSPMTLFNRRNEVWMIAMDEPECNSSEEVDFMPLP